MTGHDNANKKSVRTCLARIAKRLLKNIDGNSPDSIYHLRCAVNNEYEESPMWIVCTFHQSKGREADFKVGIGTDETTPSTRALRLY